MAIKQDTVVQEFSRIGKYCIRLLDNGNGTQVLDCREYVSSEFFEGYTRRGIRLTVGQDTLALGTILAELHNVPRHSKRERPQKKGGRK